MPSPVVSNVMEQRQLQALITAQAYYDIYLFKANVTPGPTTVDADLTPADYSGHNEPVLSIGSIATDGDGKAYALTGTITFNLAGSGTQTVYGWAVRNVAGNVTECRRLDAPVTISTTDGVSPFVIKLTLREDS